MLLALCFRFPTASDYRLSASLKFNESNPELAACLRWIENFESDPRNALYESRKLISSGVPGVLFLLVILKSGAHFTALFRAISLDNIFALKCLLGTFTEQQTINQHISLLHPRASAHHPGQFPNPSELPWRCHTMHPVAFAIRNGVKNVVVELLMARAADGSFLASLGTDLKVSSRP